MVCPRCQTDADPAAESPLTPITVGVPIARKGGAPDEIPIIADPTVQVCGTCGQTSIDGRTATYDDIRVLPIAQLDRLRGISASIVEQTRRPR